MSKEALELLEKTGKDFEQFKSTNDARLKELEAKSGTAERDEKLSKINDSLDAAEKRLKELDGLKSQSEALEQRLESFELKQNRPGTTGGASKEDQQYRDTFVDDWMRRGRQQHELETRAGSVGSDPDGGFTVPEMLDTNIIELLRDDNIMRRYASVMAVTSDEYKQLVNIGGAGSGWVGETAARAATASPSVAQFAPSFGELYAEPATTQKLLDDAVFDVEAWYADEVAKQFALMEGGAFWTGDGTNKPKGLLAYTTAATGDATRAYGTIQHRETATAGVIGADDVIDLTYDLKAGYRNNAMYFTNTTALRSIRKLKDTDGNYLWQRSLEMGQPSMLNGYGIDVDDSIPDVATGTLSLAFGDMSRAYKILDVRGIRTLRDPFTNKPYVKFYTTKRVGGGCANTQAVKLLKIQ